MSPEKHSEIVLSVFEHTVEVLTKELGRTPHIVEVCGMLASTFGQSSGVALVNGCSDVEIKRLQLNSMNAARCIQENHVKGRLH